MNRMPIDAETAAKLRAQAEALAGSRDIPLADARKQVWAEYQRARDARAQPEPPVAPPALSPPALPSPMPPSPRMAPTWHDTGDPPRRYQRTDDQFSRGKAQLDAVRRLIGQRKLA